MSLLIRQLESKDAAAFRELRHEALQKNPESFGASFEDEKDFTVQRYVERLENSTFVGAFEGEQLVGGVGLLVNSHQKVAHKGIVIAVYVKEAFRKQGIAKALMEYLEGIARERGLEQLQLSPVTSNAAAIHLYESLGYEKFGVEKEALKMGETYFDELWMVKFLR